MPDIRFSRFAHSLLRPGSKGGRVRAWISIQSLSLGIAPGLLCAGFLGGCATSEALQPEPARSSRIERQRVVSDRSQFPRSSPGTVSVADEELTLERAEEAALRGHPSLRSASWEQEARQAEVQQARRRLNPTLGLESEDFAGTGELGGFREAQTTLWVSQQIEVGGKRAARGRQAEVALESIQLDRQLLEVDVAAQARAAFVAALAAQGELDLAHAALEAAQEVHDTVAERVAAGKVSPVEQTKSAVILANARLERDGAQQALLGARSDLARTWGGTPLFGVLRGDLDRVANPPTLEQLQRRLRSSPRLERWDLEHDRNAALLEQERASAKPDLTLRGGLRYFHEYGDTAAVVSVELPLQLFDRRKHAIDAARARLARVESKRRQALLALEGQLAAAWLRLTTSHAEIMALDKEVLPDAQEVFDAVDEGYRVGKFDLLSVLDAQRTLMLARTRRLRALGSYHQALVEIEALIGGSLE